MKVFDKFKEDWDLEFHDLEDFIPPYRIRDWKTDDIDGRRWNGFKHLSK